MVDFGKVFGAATMMLIVSLVFNLGIIAINVVLGLLGFGANQLAGSGVGAAVGIAGGLIGLVLSGIGILGNLAIILYAGFSGAKKGLDMISCGLVGLIIYTIVGTITAVIGIVLGLLNLGAGVVTSGDAVTGVLGGIFGTFWLGLGIICGFGLFIMGMLLNFIIGIVGGMIGGAK